MKEWLYWFVYNFPIKGYRGFVILVWCQNGMPFKRMVKELIKGREEE